MQQKQITHEMIAITHFLHEHGDKIPVAWLVDWDGFPLPHHDGTMVSIEYHDGVPVSYADVYKMRTGKDTFKSLIGAYRPLPPPGFHKFTGAR